MQTFNAHFDGRFIVLDEPARLKPNDKVTVIAPDATDDGLADGCTRLVASLTNASFQGRKRA